MGDDESIVVQEAAFLWFAIKRFTKEVFNPRLNAMKVLVGTVIGCIGLPYAVAWYPSPSWRFLCVFGFYTCFYCAAVETCHLCLRLGRLHRVYFDCIAPRVD